MPAKLPSYIAPMLANPAEPFDSPDHLYEIKWDGFRAIAFCEGASWRLIGRRRSDFTAAYPELKLLASLPAGAALDGEIVSMKADKPDFTSLLRRRKNAAPVTFVAFDLVYEDFAWIGDQPLERRRGRLSKLLKPIADSRLVMSEGVVGGGIKYFEQAIALGLEGVVAKKLGGKYEPGQRTGAWSKFKQRRELVCVIIGYEVNDDQKLRSLVIAAESDGELVCAGQVGGGIKSAMADTLMALLKPRRRPRPAAGCTMMGTGSAARRYRWVEPDLLCRVSYLERLETGALRSPVFEGLINMKGSLS